VLQISEGSFIEAPKPDPLWKTWDAKAQKHGEHATVFHTNGDKYRGQYEGNMRHGAGTLLFKNGDKYEGEFQGGLQHGFGTHWVNKKGKLRMQYRGGFGFGKRQGQGILAYQDGGKYEGEWMAGKRDGQGKMIYIDGSVYEGMWKEGSRHGPGMCRPMPVMCAVRVSWLSVCVCDVAVLGVCGVSGRVSSVFALSRK